MAPCGQRGTDPAARPAALGHRSDFPVLALGPCHCPVVPQLPGEKGSHGCARPPGATPCDPQVLFVGTAWLPVSASPGLRLRSCPRPPVPWSPRPPGPRPPALRPRPTAVSSAVLSVVMLQQRGVTWRNRCDSWANAQDTQRGKCHFRDGRAVVPIVVPCLCVSPLRTAGGPGAG